MCQTLGFVINRTLISSFCFSSCSSFVLKNVSLEENTRVCNFGGDAKGEEESSFEFNRELATLTWKILQDKFTHIDDIPSMAFKVYAILDDLQQKHMIDVSIPKKKFEGVMEAIEKVKESESMEKNNLEELKTRLESCLREERRKNKFFAYLQAELMGVDDELKVLVSKKQKIESFLAKLEKDNRQNNDQISSIRQSILTMKTLSSSAAKEQLQHKIDDLKSFTWDPSN